MSEDLKKRLLNSDALSSLSSEQRIGDQLSKLGWSVSHGSFFVDPNTAKLREIDIVAKRAWRRKLKSGHQRVGLNLVAEVKSVRGYHLVFAPISNSDYSEQAHREWIGYAGERGGQLGDVLERAGVEPRDVARILDRFIGLAYPNDFAVMHAMLVDPPPAPFTASVFRESNVGGEKELDNSVLWKAVQAVRGAVASAQSNYLEIASMIWKVLLNTLAGTRKALRMWC